MNGPRVVPRFLDAGHRAELRRGLGWHLPRQRLGDRARISSARPWSLQALVGRDTDATYGRLYFRQNRFLRTAVALEVNLEQRSFGYDRWVRVGYPFRHDDADVVRPGPGLDHGEGTPLVPEPRLAQRPRSRRGDQPVRADAAPVPRIRGADGAAAESARQRPHLAAGRGGEARGHRDYDLGNGLVRAVQRRRRRPGPSRRSRHADGPRRGPDHLAVPLAHQPRPGLGRGSVPAGLRQPRGRAAGRVAGTADRPLAAGPRLADRGQPQRLVASRPGLHLPAGLRRRRPGRRGTAAGARRAPSAASCCGTTRATARA